MSDKPTIEIYVEENERNPWIGDTVVLFLNSTQEDRDFIKEKSEQLGLEKSWDKLTWFATRDDLVGFIFAVADRFEIDVHENARGAATGA